MEDALIVGIVFFSIVAVVKIIADTTTKRRLMDRVATDEKAARALLTHPELMNLSSLKWGIVLVGIGLAWLATNWIDYRWHEETIFGLMFLLAGIGMLIYYPIAQKKVKKIEQEERSHPPTT